jgi:hypothetical protein
MRKNYSLLIALPLSLFIYLFYRTDKTAVNQLFIYFFSYELYVYLKHLVASNIPLAGSIVYSLPGGLWVFCASALAYRFYIKIRGYRIPIGLVPVLFAIGLELGQLLHLAHGVFDISDIIFYSLGWLLATRLFDSKPANQNIFSPLTPNGFLCLSCFFCVFLAHVSR